VSKALRHAPSGITADLYRRLTKETTLTAANSLNEVLDAAAAELANEPAVRAATTWASARYAPLIITATEDTLSSEHRDDSHRVRVADPVADEVDL